MGSMIPECLIIMRVNWQNSTKNFISMITDQKRKKNGSKVEWKRKVHGWCEFLPKGL